MVSDTTEAGLEKELGPQRNMDEEAQTETPSEILGANKETDSDVENAKISPVIGWDSPEDPSNPQNWPVPKKVFHTVVPALFGFVLTVATSVYVPAIPFIMKNYNVTREIAVLPLAFYTVGFAIGPLFTAPMSELYGRRVVYWSTMTCLLVFTGISGAANSVALLTVMRLLAGFLGSGGLAVGAGTVSDLWNHQARGRAALAFIMAPFLGPALGPLMGAYIISEYNDDWRYSMWVVMFIAAPVFLLSLFMKETSPARLLYLRQKSKGIKPAHKTGDTAILLQKLGQAVIRPLHMMVLEPLVAFLSIYTGFAFAMMFSFFGSYNFVFQSIYHFGQKDIGLTFLGILVGFLLAVFTFGIFDATLYRRASIKAAGMPAPEHRLYSAMLGSFFLPIGLFWFAWAPATHVHWIVPVLAGVPFGWGALSIFLSATTYLVDVYGSANGASAVAANGILRYGFGAAFPLFTLQMYTGLGVHWAGSVFAFVGLVLTPVPWVFWFWGKDLRARSRYEVSKF